MKNLLRLEELAQFLSCLLALIVADMPWWVYPILLVGPDIGMLGYLINPRAGAISYNLLHHKGVALLLMVSGMYMNAVTIFETDSWNSDLMLWTGVILFGHASMDRIFGYGLKFGDNFHHTHLGWIGKLKGKEPLSP
ncbi:MAG: DUF4260 domain-containing protein [Flavobacteriales bacterium]|nr:DUF4260 domain-containing protein [Flavobacteriales bacterium]